MRSKRQKTRETYSDFVIGHKGEVGGVALHDRREADDQLRLKVTFFPLNEPRLLTPGNKVLVLVHVGHHIVQLLRRIPGAHSRREK